MQVNGEQCVLPSGLFSAVYLHVKMTVNEGIRRHAFQSKETLVNKMIQITNLSVSAAQNIAGYNWHKKNVFSKMLDCIE